ncbi:bifunctional diguanylate cyclase/phosphodiesterase [Aliiglaciecola litoralis]|uniref:EAL domain-containing protein n=1 Tax=Aliiglaciecola litoralis TaxID=582857 RepID=A0ABN1LDY9_9ALTE
MSVEHRQPDNKNDHLKVVSQYIIDILPTKTQTEIIELIFDTLLRNFDIDYLELYSFKRKSKALILSEAYAEKRSILQDLFIINEIPLGQGIIGQAAKSLQIESIDDVSLYPELNQNGGKYVTGLIIPVVTDGKLVGVIYCASNNTEQLPKHIQNSIYAIASVTAIKVDKIQAIDKLQHSIEKLEYSGKIQDTLFEIAELIFETSSMQEFYQRLHSCIAKLMFASNFFVGLVIDDGQAITLPYAVDEVDEVPPNEVIPLDNQRPSITGYVLNTDKPLLASKQKIQAMIDSNQVYIKGSLPNAWLGVPFGKPPLHGVVVVQSYNDDIGYTQKDEQLLCFVARHIRNAIERMQAKSDLQFLALHDPLTKLPNRSLFNDRVYHALNKCKREQDRNIALLFLDLDKFKQVNDTYGHHIGDLLLIKVAEILQQSIRESDTLSRLGGDEFAILLEDIDTKDSALKVANKIVKALETPFKLNEIQIKTSTSIGIAFHTKSNSNAESLVICADKAMYQAKQQGRNRVVLHQGDAQSDMVPTNVIEKDSLKGINENQFFFVFQPIVDLDTGEVLGAEALVRWKYSKMGTLPPNSFLNEMEENGSIVQLDVYNVKRALGHLKKWKSLLPYDFRLSVNISGLGFTSISLLEAIELEYENDPDLFRYLTLETTEKSIIKGVELTRAQMNIFSKMGIQLALDDFGTGYSSLSYLGQFKFNYIKIDRSFVSGHLVSSQQSIILESINSLARSLAIETIAEGIETQEQLELMRDLEYSMGQGFHISELLTEQQLLDLLRSKKKLMTS